MLSIGLCDWFGKGSSAVFKARWVWNLFGYCYHSVNVISFPRSQSDHIKRLPLYQHKINLFCSFIFSLTGKLRISWIACMISCWAEESMLMIDSMYSCLRSQLTAQPKINWRTKRDYKFQIIYYQSKSYTWYFLNWKWYKQTTNYFTQKKIIQLNLILLNYLKYDML
jgi:hypothetical protein